MANRKKRTYLIVLVVSAIALFIDRMIVSDHGVAPAQAIVSVPQTVSPPTAESLAIPELSFPKGVRPLSAKADIRDLFYPPQLSDNALARSGSEHSSAESDRSQPRRRNAEQFAEHHTLDAVLINERLKIAIIDGHWLTLGQSIDGCTVSDVAGNTVYVQCGDGRATLKISGTAGLPLD